MNIDINLFTVYKFEHKIRFGDKVDGGYVLCEFNSNKEPLVYDCLISGGISSNDDFSVDFIDKYKIEKCDCYGIDGSIDNLPLNLLDKMEFVKKYIGSTEDLKNTTLIDIIEKYNDIFVKMDIEGGEWPWLSVMKHENLAKISQLVIELHGITNTSWHGMTTNSFNSSCSDKSKYLEKLSNTHYLVHAHGNNADRVNQNGIPNVIELTYLNKKHFAKTPLLNDVPLPIQSMDFPNEKLYPDINLNFYPFTSSL